MRIKYATVLFCMLFKNINFASYSGMAMMNQKKNKKMASSSAPLRKQRMVCLMSEEEVQIVDRYLKKYQIKNKARWLRETILTFIRQNMEEDYPTLFKEHDMRR